MGCACDGERWYDKKDMLNSILVWESMPREVVAPQNFGPRFASWVPNLYTAKCVIHRKPYSCRLQNGRRIFESKRPLLYKNGIAFIIFGLYLQVTHYYKLQKTDKQDSQYLTTFAE